MLPISQCPGRRRTDIGHNQTDIREIAYRRMTGAVRSVEIATIDSIRASGGAAEFVGPQRMQFELIVHLASGTTVHGVDFTTYPLEAGDVLWVHAGQVQQWGDIDAIDGVVCMFPPTIFDTATTELLGSLDGWTRSHWPAATCAAFGLDADFQALLSHYWRLGTARDLSPAGCDAAMVHLTAALAVTLAATPSTSTAAGRVPHASFRRFRDEVDRHFAADRSVRSYARRLGFSERSLHRLTVDHAGRTPKQVIDDRVMLEAKRLLVHGDLPISAIARALSFDDQSNFTKSFRKSVGMTPSEFRSQHS